MNSLQRLIAACLGYCATALPALAIEPNDLHGTYLGYAIVEDVNDGTRREREMTITIDGYKRYGLRIHWTSVELVNGRRDLPGVAYRSDELLLEPSENDQYFIATSPHSPFSQRENEQPLSGDPMRWATLDDDSLEVISFVILQDGQYEMQRYDRQLDAEGIRLTFERIVDGNIVRKISGFARRVDAP